MNDTMTKIETATLATASLEELLTAALTHASKDKSLPALNGVKIWATGNLLYTFATDRYRLIEGYLPAEGELDARLYSYDDVKKIIAACKQVRKENKLATLSLAGDILSITIGADTLTAYAVNATHPPYEHLFPTEEPIPTANITINPAFFADYAKINSKQGVKMKFYGERKPIVIDLGQGYRALLMPMRII